MKAATRLNLRALTAFFISIHAAREGGDAKIIYPMCELDISIHAAREGGDYNMPILFVDIVISIHAAREGGDLNAAEIRGNLINFNPRRP